LLELENEHDRNFSLSLSAIPKEEMEDVYMQIMKDRDALRDATTALTSAPLLNEPAADEEEAVPFVAPLKVRALCSNEG
jgi:hypothetical protein